MGGPVTAEAHLALAAWWRGAGERVAPNADALARVLDIESRYGLSLPEDFRTYLLETAPAEELWDTEDMTWWPVDRVRNMPDEYATFNHPVWESDLTGEPETWLFFADYMIWCWAWAICCSDGEDRGKVAFIGGPDRIVAASFSDFVGQYLREPVAICNGETSEETARRHEQDSAWSARRGRLIRFWSKVGWIIMLVALWRLLAAFLDRVP